LGNILAKKKTKVKKLNYLAAFQYDLEINNPDVLVDFLEGDSKDTLEDYLNIELDEDSSVPQLDDLVRIYKDNHGTVFKYPEAKAEVTKANDYDDLKKDVLEKVFEEGDITPTYTQLLAAEEARSNPSPMGAI
jgi:hypothetical protein